MNIIIISLKIFVVIVFSYMIYKTFEIRDTSSVQTLTVNKRGIVRKIFSAKELSNIEICFKKLSIPYNTVTVLGLFWAGIIISISVFFICNFIFPLKSISFIIACPLVLTPFWLIKYIASKEQEKLEYGLNDFFIQLKSALKVNSEIVEALRRIQNIAMEPFLGYTKQLLIEINTGKLPEKALENFAYKVNIKKFSFYINNLRYCQVYGGDITTLTEKTQETLSEALKQKRKRVKETRSICIILYILIIIDIYMYFSFIQGNRYYLDIMTNTDVGRCILDINFLSIWGILWLSRIVKRFDY